MINLSEEKQSYLSHQIVSLLLSRQLAQSSSQNILFEAVKKAVQNFVQEWSDMERDITQKIQSIKRGVHQGSSEWDILYSQFLEESFRKKSRLFVKK